MSLFTASNGVVLDEHGDEYDVQLRHRKGDTHEARKEFYLHLRDKELGQTREGNIVVRPISDDEVLVMNETAGRAETWYRHQISAYPGVFGHDEAKRYFEAHPVKPWHDAKPGEVWEITYRSPRGLHTVNYTGIESARRIWPEGDSDG